MNRIALLMRNRAEVVDRLSHHNHNEAESSFAYRHADWTAGVRRFHAADHAVGRQHRDRAHTAFAEMLLHFGDDVDWVGHFKTVRGDAERLINRRQIALSKLNVDHRPDDLHDFSNLSVASSVRRSHIYSINS